MFSVATSVTTVFTLTGPQDRLRQIAEERAYRTCAADQMTWEDDTTLVMTLENGIGTPFLHHGDGLSDEYPDVSIRGMEYFDCFDDPSFAKWQGQRPDGFRLRMASPLFSFGCPQHTMRRMASA